MSQQLAKSAFRGVLPILFGFLVASCGGDSPTDPEDRDTAAPSVSIEQPAADGSFATNESAVDLAGTASDAGGVARVEWKSDQGASGTAEGTRNWRVTDLPLESGVNNITVTALDEAGNTATDAITVIRDEQAPSVTITSPTETPAYHTVRREIKLAGEASDNRSIDRIEWSTSAGASDTATGQESWSASHVPSPVGTTTVEVTVHDEAGNTATDTLQMHGYLNLGKLTIKPATVLTGAQDPIRVQLSVDADRQLSGPVHLKVLGPDNAVTEEIGRLHDDGRLSHGDDILGDNVYSGLFVFDMPNPREIPLQATVEAENLADTVDARSLPVRLSIHEPVAGQAVEERRFVQDSAVDKLSSYLDGDVVPAVDSLATWLEGRPEVASVSRADSTTVMIDYESGLMGAVVVSVRRGSGWTEAGIGPIPPPAPEVPGPRAMDLPGRSDLATPWRGLRDTIPDRDGPEVPLERQTRGVFAPDAMLRAAQGTGGPLAQSFEDRIQNRNVLLYSPHQDHFDPNDSGNEVRGVFGESPFRFQVDYLEDRDATVAALLDLSRYGLILLETHGHWTGLLTTGELVGDGTKYQALQQDGQVAVAKNIAIEDPFLGIIDREEDVYAVTPLFFRQNTSSLPNSLVILDACYSLSSGSGLASAFASAGAGAVVGFDDLQTSPFSEAMVDELVRAMVLDGQTLGEGFTPGECDPDAPGCFVKADFSNDALAYPTGLINGDFEFGSLEGWTTSGDGRIITQLGPESPFQGNFMGIISTGLGFTTQSGAVFQSVRVDPDQTQLSLRWNFFSEEFLEYVGSQYQDFLRIQIHHQDGTETIFHRNIDEFANEYDLVPVSPEIVFDRGDVYKTGWQELTVDLSSYAGEVITVRIQVGDIGDSYFDSAALLDVVSIE